MIKLKSYKELIALTKEAVDKTLAPVRAKAMRCKAELERAKLEETLISTEQKLQEACSQKDLNFDTIINLLDEHDLVARKLEQFANIIEHLFPD